MMYGSVIYSKTLHQPTACKRMMGYACRDTVEEREHMGEVDADGRMMLKCKSK
jgi:hypothetical protein